MDKTYQNGNKMSYPYARIVSRETGKPYMHESNDPIADAIESQHPVLTNYKTQITQLETQLASAKADVGTMRQRWQGVLTAKNRLEDNLKEILMDVHNNGDEDVAKSIAKATGIDLTVSKKFEVNVTFTIDVEMEIGEEIDPEWDLDFSVRHDYVIDYQSDIVYSNEIS